MSGVWHTRGVNDGDWTDGELLVGSVTRSDLFAVLYRRHAEAVLAYFFRRTSCAQTAADLTAETFAQAFTSRHRFVDTGAPARAWLFTIARRQLARFARAERVSGRYRRRVGLDPVVLEPVDYERIEDTADAKVWAAAVNDALDRLPDGQAAAVRMRIGLGLPYEDVARELGCSQGAARVRVSRGLTTLSDMLEGQ